MFADENEGRLPARGVGAGSERWPSAFRNYLKDSTEVYYCPRAYDDPEIKADPYSNSHNNTSYIINGFNDVVPYGTTQAVGLDNLPNPTETILFGESKKGDGNYYMDLDEGNEKVVLDNVRHKLGGCFIFADGHSQFIKNPETVLQKLWWVNKEYVAPSP